MPHDRFYISHPLLKGDRLSLEGEEFNHVTRVMRARTGDRLECLNGQGRLATVEVGAIHKKEAELSVLESHFTPKPPFNLILAQALPRQNHLDFIVEKGCELGMTELWLFEGERSERDELSPTHQTRLSHLMIAALKQCGGLWLPEVKQLPPLKKWDRLPYPAFYGTLEKGALPLVKVLGHDSGVIFFTGPEKGLSEEEMALLKNLGAQGVTLNPHILRTETASLAALALLSHHLMT